MTIWYIGPSGSDSTGNGSSGSPYLTVSKCLSVGVDGDTIKALTGTYTIGSTTNITKQFTITSNTGVATDVIFNSSSTIFNIQNSNITISYVTLQTSYAGELITIDRNSTGSTVPTFYTGNSINHCNIKYVTYGLALNGTFSVDNNTFTRMSGTNVVSIMRIYSTRGTCSISSNNFTDSGSVQYVIYLTSTGTGSYFDMCNSKGGTLTINANTGNFSNNGQSATLLYCDYFNQFTYVTNPSMDYNPNTRISLVITNNNFTLTTMAKVIFINAKSNSDFNTFGSCNINTNTISNTDYGILHLGKDTSTHNALTIPSSDLTRAIFKLYSNVSDTVVPAGKIMWFDWADITTVFSDTAGTVQITDGQMVGCIKSKGVYTNKLVNTGNNYAFSYRMLMNSLGSLQMMNGGTGTVFDYSDTATHLNASLGFTLFVVFQVYGLTYYNPIRTLSSNCKLYNGGGQITQGLGFSIGQNFSATATGTDTRPRIYAVVADPVSGITSCYCDSTITLKKSGTYSSQFFTDTISQMGPYYSNGHSRYGEWILYDRPLTSTSNPTLSSVISSLASKWNAY